MDKETFGYRNASFNLGITLIFGASGDKETLFCIEFRIVYMIFS